MREPQVPIAEERRKEILKMKPVLIVEDEAIMRESLRDWLKDEGYEVETAERGEEALQMIGEVDFGIVVLDMKLPGKDGLEVLKEARAQRPQLKGIIITAYPSVETAVEAIKLGALDYLPKPFAPDALEKLIRETLGPAQVAIRPKAAVKEAVVEAPAVEEVKVEEAVVEAPVVEEVKVEEVITITEEEIPAHLQQGEEHLKAGRYGEALKEFEAILRVAPGNLETRVLIRSAKEALAEPSIETVTEEARPKYCVWMALGMVSYRICTNNYDCMSCEFDQEMQEKMASGETPELDEALARFRELPGSQRLCRYALKGDVSHRICSRLFQCATCEFGQMMDDALQQKLAQRAAELAARQEALHQKDQSWWWPYWKSNVPTSSARSHSTN